MRRYLRTTGSLVISLVMVLSLTSCGGDSADTSSGSGPFGALNVYLTDAPTDGLDEVVVAITGLKVKHSGEPVERSILDPLPPPINLLDYQGGKQLLLVEGASVPAGTYQFIEVNLDQGQSYIIEDGQKLPLKITNQKIKVLGGFEVQAGVQVSVVLDFDADASLVKLGSGDWLLKPVIVKK